MSNGDVAGEMAQGFLVEYLRDETHAGESFDTLTIRGSYASALLPSVLKGEQREIGKPGDIFVRGINTKNTASFVQINTLFVSDGL
jgi:hypothetical protein